MTIKKEFLKNKPTNKDRINFMVSEVQTANSSYPVSRGELVGRTVLWFNKQ